MFRRPLWSTVESRGCLLDKKFEKMRFSGSLWGWKLFNTTRKMYKTFTSIYLTTGSRVKTAKEINTIFKIKDGGGLLWSKLSAEIPHHFRIGRCTGEDCRYWSVVTTIGTLLPKHNEMLYLFNSVISISSVLIRLKKSKYLNFIIFNQLTSKIAVRAMIMRHT